MPSTTPETTGKEVVMSERYGQVKVVKVAQSTSDVGRAKIVGKARDRTGRKLARWRLPFHPCDLHPRSRDACPKLAVPLDLRLRYVHAVLVHLTAPSSLFADLGA